MGLFLRAVTANQRMSALPSAVVAKMGGQTPRGEFSVWQLLVKHPQKPDSSGKSNSLMCVMKEPEAEVARIGSVKPLRHRLSQKR